MELTVAEERVILKYRELHAKRPATLIIEFHRSGEIDMKETRTERIFNKNPLQSNK